MQQVRLGSATIEMIKGDITGQQVDAVVNAANSSLLGGSGVDGAIHRAAGPQLLEACRRLGGCPTGDARITRGFNLPARYVIHAVGPRYRDGHSGEAGLLEATYRASLLRADEHQLESIAFPAISTGIYGYPREAAALIALRTVKHYLTTEETRLKLVRFVLWNEEAYADFATALQSLLEKNNA